MFIFSFFIIIAISQFVSNKLLNISDNNSISYSYSRRDSLIIVALFGVGFVLQILPIEGTSIYNILLFLYAFAILIIMIVIATFKKILIEKQREEILTVFSVLEPVIPKEAKVINKETGETELRDINNPPFTLGYEKNQINKITIGINPNSFKETVATNLCLSLNKYLPNYEWVNEFDFASRECSFIGTPLPPHIAKYKGSWLRPAEFIPIGLSGLGEVSWTINSIKNAGRSNYIYEDGKIAKTVDTPSAPQALCVGSPLGLNTVIPTTTGYKTMGTIEIGDKVFGLDNKPVEVIKIEQINYNPTEVYELIFACAFYQIKVISDAIHRFPVVTKVRTDINDTDFFKPVCCKNLVENESIIIGNNRELRLISKKLIKPQPVRCITVNSDEHIFLIVDKKDESWTGGNRYNLPAIYTYNTGGGKAICVNQTVGVQSNEE